MCNLIYIHIHSFQETHHLFHHTSSHPYIILINLMLSMAESKAPLSQDPWYFQYGKSMNTNKDHHDDTSSSTSSFEASTISNDSSSFSLDTTDDASSCLSSSNSNEGLYDLSELMAELPIKRGLSKYYQGKSESFTSLSSVTSLEDLVKKVPSYKRNMKTSKSCSLLPKRVISKKGSRGGSFPSSSSSRSGSLINSCRPPMIPK